MPWWDILKRKEDDGQTASPTAAEQVERQSPVVTREALAAHPQLQRRQIDPSDPEIRERQRKRLLLKVQNLRYDVQHAESALQEPNRWTMRVEELTAAIEQAKRDADTIMHAPPGSPGATLPETRISIDAVRTIPAAEVSVSIGRVTLRYVEELDWAERGHQKAPVQLQCAEGDIAALIPESVPSDQHDPLRDHLAYSLSLLIEDIREATLDEKPLPRFTLADLARPCTECGGWLDIKHRCPACQERRWKVDGLRTDRERLIRERNATLEDLQRLRERLPILRRQLVDAQTALDALGASSTE